MGAVVKLFRSFITGPEEQKPEPLPPPQPAQDPTPPPVNRVDPEVVEARQRERRRQAQAAGRDSTIRTSPQGLPSRSSQRKTVLGE